MISLHFSNILAPPTISSERKSPLVSGAAGCNHSRTWPWQIRSVTNISGFFNTGLEGQYWFVRTQWHCWISLCVALTPVIKSHKQHCTCWSLPQQMSLVFDKKEAKLHTLKWSCWWAYRHRPRDFIIMLRENYQHRLCLQSWEFSLSKHVLEDHSSRYNAPPQTRHHSVLRMPGRVCSTSHLNCRE